MSRKVYDDQTGAKEEWAKLKDATLKQKLQYLIEYYGLAALVVLAVIIFLATYIPACIRNSRPNVISGEFLMVEPSEEGIEELRLLMCENLGEDPEKIGISISNKLIDTEDISQLSTMSELIVARIMAKDVDFYYGPLDLLAGYINTEDYDGNYFASLYDFLPEDLVATLEAQGRLLYLQMADGTSFPYLINPNGSRLMDMLDLYDTTDGYIALVINSEHADALVELCRLIAEE